MKALFTTIRGWSLIFGALVSLLFLNAARRVAFPEWGRYNDSIAENVITPTKTDRCVTCHTDMPRRHSGTHVKTHPPERFGCTFCHEGVGRAVTSVAAHAAGHPDLALLTGADVQSRCLNCHGQQFQLDNAPILNEGKRLIYEKRCIRCHQVSSFAAEYPNLQRYYAAGNLGRIAGGMPADWMFRFVKRPQAVARRTGMPFFGFSDEDSAAIVAYLDSKKEPLRESGFNEARFRAASPQRGLQLVSTLGCLGCHAVGGQGSPQAVDGSLDMGNLGQMFTPEFLFGWLYPVGAGHQPAIPLAELEAYDLTAWLATQKALPASTFPVPRIDPGAAQRGEQLIRENNCYGCHTIPGFENVPPSLPELSTVGDKVMDKGSRRDYYVARILNPKSVDPDSRMPVIAMTEREAHSIATVLLGLRRDPVARSFRTEISERQEIIQSADRMVMHQFKCHLCHRIPWQKGEQSPPINGPDLAVTAEKLTISQIAEKLSSPHRQVPNQTRMPYYQLGDEEVLTLIQALRLR